MASVLPGLLFAAIGTAGALLANQLVGQVGTLTWAVVLGVTVANVGLLPDRARPGVNLATRRLLRVGVVLLGLSLSLGAIVALGPGLIAVVVLTLLCTMLATTWLGLRMGLSRPRSLLIGTGFAICGAAAIAAMEEVADADEEDVTVAIAMVTMFGTVAMASLPLLQPLLGLTGAELGAWAGASVHEVGQVVAAASPAGATAVAVAVVVKLTRVLLLAPVVASVSVVRRRRARAGAAVAVNASLPPLVPLFVLGFLGCVLLRATGMLPASAIEVAGYLQTLALGAALFGMGTSVHVPTLVRHAGRPMVLSAISTVVIACVSLGGVLWAMRMT